VRTRVDTALDVNSFLKSKTVLVRSGAYLEGGTHGAPPKLGKQA